MPATRRDVPRASAGVAALGALAGCPGDSASPDDFEAPTGPVTTAPVPSDPSRFTYAVMGTDDPAVLGTYYGSWKCPHCADFSTGFLGDLATEYVEPGALALRYRSIAYYGGDTFLGTDAPRAARAGLAVWNVDPGSYWRFHELVMKNQPPESKT